MGLNFEVKVECLYEQQRKFEFCSEIERYTQTYCESQVTSKKYLIDKMYRHCPPDKYNFHIQGAWYGTLIVPYLLNNFSANIDWLHVNDIDKGVRRILKSYTNQHTDRFYITDYDMFQTTDWHEYLGEKNLLINTSCEHMPNLSSLNSGDPDMLYVLQSNDDYDHPEHTNCVGDAEELAFKSGLNRIYFAGEVQCKKFKRFTVIGQR